MVSPNNLRTWDITVMKKKNSRFSMMSEQLRLLFIQNLVSFKISNSPRNSLIPNFLIKQRERERVLQK